jgi:hypothetical protein
MVFNEEPVRLFIDDENPMYPMPSIQNSTTKLQVEGQEIDEIKTHLKIFSDIAGVLK